MASETLSFVLLWPDLRTGRNDSVDTFSSLWPQCPQCTGESSVALAPRSLAPTGLTLQPQSLLQIVLLVKHTQFHVTSEDLFRFTELEQ